MLTCFLMNMNCSFTFFLGVTFFIQNSLNELFDPKIISFFPTFFCDVTLAFTRKIDYFPGRIVTYSSVPKQRTWLKITCALRLPLALPFLIENF